MLDENPSNEHTGGDDQIDDPVRMYLMQMGEIPLLKPRGRVAIARRIERGRRHFRHCMLASDYVSRRPSTCWKTSATTGCGWIAQSRFR